MTRLFRYIFIAFCLIAFNLCGLPCFGSPAMAQDQQSPSSGLQALAELSRIKRPMPPDTIPYNYTIVFQINEAGDDPEKEPFTAVLAVSPSLSGEARVTVLSQSSEDKPDALKALLKKMTSPETTQVDLAKEFWCEGKENDLLNQEVSIEDFQIVSETETEIVVRPDIEKMAKIMMSSDNFAQADGDSSKTAKRLLKRLEGEFTISKKDAHLKHFRIWMTRPMSVKLIAKIKEMELTQSCDIAPNGVAYKQATSMHLIVKALGMSVVQNMNINVRDLKPTP